ncbi:MAG TPA: trypsin-like peptidase domain-containing protein [Ardenticatenaceae bacterium]|nr:trypsin-like peptidase domain-containing protein [Ardenticatenaceae bacterium]
MRGIEMEQTEDFTSGEPWRRRLQRLRVGLRSAALFAAGVAAALVALLIYRTLMPGPPPLTLSEVNDTVAQALASATPPPPFSTRVYQVIQPSLVLIQTELSPAEEAEDDEANALGSGVVVNASGDILTALHVIADAEDIEVTFADGTRSHARVTATQPENDIAVLNAGQLPPQIVPATLGNPNALRVGDEAFAVGNPFGLYGSMSAGVISGFERSFRPPDSDRRLEGLIQIDAAVNSGNSGGPLLNRAGHVVGIVVGIVNPTEQEVFIGIGFAVPITVAAAGAGSPPY